MDLPPTPIGARQGMREIAAAVLAIPGFLWVAVASAVAFESTLPDRLVPALVILAPGAAFFATAIGLVRNWRWAPAAFVLAVVSTLIVLSLSLGSIDWRGYP